MNRVAQICQPRRIRPGPASDVDDSRWWERQHPFQHLPGAGELQLERPGPESRLLGELLIVGKDLCGWFHSGTLDAADATASSPSATSVLRQPHALSLHPRELLIATCEA